MANLVELREIPCVKPSEEQAGRGFCDQCLSEADAFVFEAERVLRATASIVRSEGIRRSRTQILGRPSFAYFSWPFKKSQCRAALARLSVNNHSRLNQRKIQNPVQFASLIGTLRIDVFYCSPLLTMPSWQYID
ncbi:hypothetical protein [Deefgea rivuli]|uniref:hypothetical protein n=1 Tax=Deefgea rivuli TaxID=400948 RepID=UPI000489EA53|nr:hypothetical protein [Deefgea rivuli]